MIAVALVAVATFAFCFVALLVITAGPPQPADPDTD